MQYIGISCQVKTVLLQLHNDIQKKDVTSSEFQVFKFILYFRLFTQHNESKEYRFMICNTETQTQTQTDRHTHIHICT